MPNTPLPNYSHFITTPYGASFALPEKDQQTLFAVYRSFSPAIRAHLASDKTGSAIRTLAEQHGVPADQAAGAALALYLVIIRRNAAVLPQLLQDMLPLNKAQAAALAQALDDAIFSPIQDELNLYWQQVSEQEQQLFAAYHTLPTSVRDYLASDKTGDAIQAVLERHHMPTELSSKVSLAIFYTVADHRNLTNMLRGTLMVTRAEAEQLGQDILQTILAPIKEELEKHWQSVQSGRKTSLTTPSNEEDNRTPPAPLQKGKARGRASKNVVDLKKRRRPEPPVPPRMPRAE
ncbi:MAG: hypothetical protein COT71_00870 [Candidatus Andersenbacteria bacterium CG10_big_fil_rev_8_21_14_0_10_54_11]|uniref:Uncharacterized protein n=1 Tax=Candidatus Andersenbacteria bacterium CG10_big_fil_rev_8_21_14_0_10_54_11 TaxID=1974485 RepID=A0A2M6X071_9BACT|nr:MAG: hypothetical protein COT71_00870 [Candidatus Andersenbacteria bacterium CG10_big_fil_rev_8_21_14_0_10_54_11]